MKSLKRFRLWIIIIICAGILIIFRPKYEQFQDAVAANYNLSQADPSADPTIRGSIEYNYNKNCQMLNMRISEINGVQTNLANIKSQINMGAINVQTALLKLKTMNDNFLNCGGPVPQNMLGISSNTRDSYCRAISDSLTSFTYEMNKNPTSNPNLGGLTDTTQKNVAGINALINQQYENVMAYSTLINQLSISLRCDLAGNIP
jgi:hypothetical protein